jgi:NAD(P)-dependent dehydrogenase (short-subunit alcohol dehydrogenase family)
VALAGCADERAVRVPDERLDAAVRGKVIIVTGSSYWIGEATARRLARAGATVLQVARTAEGWKQSPRRSGQAAAGLTHTRPSLADPAAIEQFAVAVDAGAEVGPPRQGVDRGRADSPDGTLVGEAVVSRAHNITPSFVRPVDAVGNLFRVPTDLLMRQYFRRTERAAKPEETP